MDRVFCAIMKDSELALKSIVLRKRLLTYIKHAGAGHTGGSLSCVDILNVLYNRVLNVSPETMGDPARDRYVQSKGHSVEALYVVLADRGFFPEPDLRTLCQYQSPYVGHPTRKIPGIEQNTGALGHGLSFAAGAALGGRMSGLGVRVFVLLGDGELAEGSNWEAAMMAAHYGLDRLVAIVDWNGLQITGRTREVCDPSPLADKFTAFGWAVFEVDGHDLESMTELFRSLPVEAGKPTAVIAHTVKGKGVAFMEDQGKWHHGVPDDGQFAEAMAGLERCETELLQGFREGARMAGE